jgi:tetratricopeptide (TPR) repeat protein
MVRAAWTPWFLGDLNECVRIFTEAREYMRSTGAQQVLPFCLGRLAQIATQLGDFARLIEVERERTEAASVHESKLIRVHAPANAAFGLAFLSGENDEAIAAAYRLAAITEEFGEVIAGPKLKLGRALCAAGRYGDAVPALLQAVHLEEARASVGDSGEARQELARAQLALGDVASARASAELAYREIPATDMLSRTTTATALAMVRAADGNFAEADRLHRDAVAINERTGYQLIATGARQSYAEFLLVQGRAAEARPLLEKVRDFYAHPLVVKRRQRAEELLRRCDEVRA